AKRPGGPKGLVGRFNCLCDFGISGIGKFFDELSREGIDRCICHVFLPALQVIGVSLEIGNFCTLSALFNQSWFVRG
ncbi:hypothetical protein C3404_29200, partial [Citrobacter freundii complex sp. CFNIH11]